MKYNNLQGLVGQEQKLEELMTLNNEVFNNIQLLEQENEWYEHIFRTENQRSEIKELKNKNRKIDSNLKSNVLVLDKAISEAYFKKYGEHVKNL